MESTAKFLFHISKDVSSMLAEDANPAFETTMSTPPSSSTARSNERATDPSSVTLQVTAAHRIRPEIGGNLAPRLLDRFGVDVGEHHAAPSLTRRRAVALPMPPAPPVT